MTRKNATLPSCRGGEAERWTGMIGIPRHHGLRDHGGGPKAGRREEKARCLVPRRHQIKMSRRGSQISTSSSTQVQHHIYPDTNSERTEIFREMGHFYYEPQLPLADALGTQNKLHELLYAATPLPEA